jgi:hypothetical protein
MLSGSSLGALRELGAVADMIFTLLSFVSVIILFNLLRWSLVSPIFLAKMWTICFIDCLFAPLTFDQGREMLYDFLVDEVSSLMLKSSLFSQKKTPICAASMSVEIHASLKRFLMQCDFLNSEKLWNTVQLSSSCLRHWFICTNFIQSSITPSFTSSAEEKNINCCSCIGIVKFLLPIRLCIFLIPAMVMSEGRKVCNYYMWVCKVGFFTTDGCQKGVMNNSLLLVIASYSIDNSPIQFLQYCSICILCLSIIGVRQGMMRLVKKTKKIWEIW